MPQVLITFNFSIPYIGTTVRGALLNMENFLKNSYFSGSWREGYVACPLTKRGIFAVIYGILL